MRCTFVCIFIVLHIQSSYAEKYEKKGEAILKAVAAKKTSWTAQIHDEFVGKDETELAQWLGVKREFLTRPTKPPGEKPKNPPTKGRNDGGDGEARIRRKRQAIPASYDWRDNTKCLSMSQIRIQKCGDCWAVSSAAAISDRYCLQTGENRYFSARHLDSCVYGKAGGCDGGWPEDVMKFYTEKGLATGGDPSVPAQPPGCLPYPALMTNAVQCAAVCDDGSSFDIKKGRTYHTISSKNVTEIQLEILTYGPVVVVYEIFADFYYNGPGVYQYVTGDSVGFHAVRMIGWGEENGVPYWLCLNQWKSQGAFKILRGSNHCGIEKIVSLAYPAESFA